MKEVKRHLYLNGDRELVVEDSAKCKDLIEAGWGLDRNTISNIVDEEQTPENEDKKIPLSAYTNGEILLMLEEIKQECVKRELEISEVIPFDEDSDGEGDVDLNTLDRDVLYEMAKERELSIPANIGKEKLIDRLMESQDEK